MQGIKMDGVPSNIQLHQKVEAHARVSISFFEMPYGISCFVSAPPITLGILS